MGLEYVVAVVSISSLCCEGVSISRQVTPRNIRVRKVPGWKFGKQNAR